MHERSEVWSGVLESLSTKRTVTQADVLATIDCTGPSIPRLVEDVMAKMCDSGWLVQTTGGYQAGPSFASRPSPTARTQSARSRL